MVVTWWIVAFLRSVKICNCVSGIEITVPHSAIAKCNVRILE